jgi:hypothetical protein
MRMRILGGILLAIVSLLGHVHAATPVNRVILDSLVAEIPTGAVWRHIESTSQRAVLERTADGQRTTLSLSDQPIAPLPDDKAFLRFAEDQQTSSLSKLEMVSIHYNGTHKKGALCLAYDGIYWDKSDQVSPFITFRGQLCRHPGSAARMAQIEVVERSGSKEAAYKIDLLELSEEVVNAVQFTELPKEGRPRP